MQREPDNVVLTAHGAELLRAIRDRHPELSAAEIVEGALAERVAREARHAVPSRTVEEIRAWINRLAAFSDKIPARPGETFGRDMIYQDHA